VNDPRGALPPAIRADPSRIPGKSASHTVGATDFVAVCEPYGPTMIFKRVLVGNDGSSAAMQALRLARRLKVPDGRLFALTVAEVHFAVHARWDAGEWDTRIRADAETARIAAARELRDDPGAAARVVTGYAEPALLRASEEWGADLVAVGSHGHSRMAGILLGSVSTRLVHDAKCAVLVTRGEPNIEAFPSSIIVGVDTSPASREAEVVAEAIGASADARVRRLTATGGKRLPDDAVLRAELDARSPVEALVDASRCSDLLVVGSRGLHGLAALGSVAERVAHEASCPVLIVRASEGTTTRPDREARRPRAAARAAS
jgi:nucleotide-binding universal stress UspA family protein